VAVTITDASLVVWNYLKTNALAADLRALVVSGADNIYESGDINEAVLTAAVDTRRTASETDKLLAISVQDAGERSDPRNSLHFLQFVVVRAFDRNRGYRNIRSARIEIMELLKHTKFSQNVASDLGRGILDVRYSDRTGHRFDAVSAVEYEAISYVFRMVKQEG